MVPGNWAFKIPTSSDLLLPETLHAESGWPVTAGR